IKDRALLESLSPIHAVDKLRSPLFVYQGANDQHVHKEQADKIVRALRERGILVEYMVPTDEGHTVARRANEIELYVRVLRFLADALQGGTSSTPMNGMIGSPGASTWRIVPGSNGRPSRLLRSVAFWMST